MSKNRILASLLSNDTSKVKEVYIDSDSVVTSASLGVTVAAGTATYSSADTLPASANNGDQALVTSTNRLYIHSNGGWYNIALINSTPYWSSEASSSYVLSTTGTSTVITILAIDSEGIPITYTAVADSDFNQTATITKDSDNGRTFTITPTDSENGAAVSGSGTVTFKASDGVNLVSTLSTFTLTFITSVENSKYTTLLAKADTAGTDNQVDASTNGFTITEVGNVTSTALSPYHPGGYSTYFDGSGDYLDISSSNNFIFGTGAFTVECWFYSTDLNHKGGTQYPHLICINSYTNGVYLRPHYNGTSYNVYVGGTSYTFSTTIEENVWTHVAVVRDGSGNLKLFENGIQIGSTVTGVNYNISTNSSNNRIGAAIHTSGEEFKGYIKDVRVTNTAVYTTNFTSPTETLTAIANTQLLTCHLPYIADGSSNNHTITIVGNTSTKRFTPYDYEPYAKADYGGSVYFDGTGDYMTIDLGANGGPDGDFTIEFWVYNESGTTNSGFFNMSATAGGFSSNSTALALGKTTYYNFYYGTGSQAMGSFSGHLGWQHFAMVRSGSTITLYHHGKVITTQSESGDFSSYRYIAIGGYYSTSYLHTGYIADFRYVKGTAVYTSNFTPPTAPLTAITNTSLLTCTNKNDIWDVGNGGLLTKVGNATSSNTQRKFTSSSAMYFDGSGDSISFTAGYDDPLYNFGTHDWTLEGWFYIQTLSGGRNLFSFLRAGTNEATPHVYTDGTDLRYYVSGADRIIGSSALTVNTWHHIAATRSGNDHKLFVDGTQVGSTWTNAQTYVQGRPVLGDYHISLGNLTGGTNLLHGYAQDFRITKGLARYTSAFTPPTVEFSG